MDQESEDGITGKVNRRSECGRMHNVVYRIINANEASDSESSNSHSNRGSITATNSTTTGNAKSHIESKRVNKNT